MTNLNMRRILKTPTLRMQAGGEYDAANAAKLQAFAAAEPGLGAGPQTPARAGRGSINPEMANPAMTARPMAPPTPPMLREGNSFGDAASFRPGASPTAFSTGRSNGMPSEQNMAAADGFAQRDAAALDRLRNEGAFVTPTRQAPSTKFPMSNFDPAAPSAVRAQQPLTVSANPASAPANSVTPPGVSPMPAGTNPNAGKYGSAPVGTEAFAWTPMAMPTFGMENGGEVPKHEFPDGLPGHARGLGGEVKGAKGPDKVPSMYTDKEFVASVPMLEKRPGLREYLDDLRTEVLAEKGMTPEQADAKAVSGGTLRAEAGGAFKPGQFAGDWLNRAQAGASEFTKATQDTLGKIRGGLEDLGGQADRTTGKPVGGGYADHFKPDAEAAASKGLQRAGTAAKWGGRAMAGVGPAMEAKDIYDVATDANTTKTDVATQVGEGAGKLASAYLGMKAGAAGGAALGSLGAGAGAIPGGLIGGALGGAAGYFGGEKLIGGLRSATGGDARSPDEQIDARQTAARKAATPQSAAAGVAPTLRAQQLAAQAVAPNTTGTQAPAPVKLGDTREVDEYAGTMQVYTKGPGGDKAGWTIVSTPAAKQERRLREQAYDQRMKDDYERATNGPNGWRTQEAARLRREEDSTPMSKNKREALTARRGQEATLQAAVMQNQTSRDNNAATNETTLRNQTLSAQGERTKSVAAKAESDRKYELDVARLGIEAANKARDDKRGGEKAFDDRVLGMVGVDKEGKPDMGAASAVRNTVSTFVAEKQVRAQAALERNPGNKDAARVLEHINRTGLSGVDEETLREIMLDHKARKVAKAGAGWTPWGGTAASSDKPLTSLRFQDSWLPFADKYVGDNGLVLTDDDMEANPDFTKFLGAKTK